jgi:histidyl-tRNA synthetase
MKIQAPPGMRDFYPEDMRLQNWLFEQWRSVSRAFGFQEYEGPIFEHLDLYTLKSGQEIVGQLFNFEDRGGRRFALRPEMTPTLARMVAARANALGRPIKWFSIPRMCRAERPQRGRLREFFQWNVDVLGSDDPLADAEVIAVAVEFLRRVGLHESEVVMKLSSRPLISAVLDGLGLAGPLHAPACTVIDRLERLSTDEFDRQWAGTVGPQVPGAQIRELLKEATLDEFCRRAAASGPAGEAAVEQFRSLWDRLASFGAGGYCEFDARIVRGLDYYTGVVFELHLRRGELRALLGGGRYDSLVGLLGGPPLPAVGFGSGDAPLLEALRELGKLPIPAGSLDVFVIDANPSLFEQVLKLVGPLRRAGLAVEFSYKRQTLGKQLKLASQRGARRAILVGAEEAGPGELIVRDLEKGTQVSLRADELLEDPWTHLRVRRTPPDLPGGW